MLSDDRSYPGQELAHPGVDPGLVSLAAPDAPGEDAGQLVPGLTGLAGLLHHQGAAAVPLAGVLPPVRVAGTEEMVRDLLPVAGPEELRLTLSIGQDGQINLLQDWGKWAS